MPPSSSLLSSEVAHFKRLASSWQNPNGPLYTLHRLNPLRLAYVRQFVKINQAAASAANSTINNNNATTTTTIGQNNMASESYSPYLVSNCLDIGCGAGIATKELANWCRNVKAVEPTTELVNVAPKQENVQYYNGLLEDLIESDAKKYDLVTALEVVEHVADLEFFVKCLSKVLKEDGTLILSTLNRTQKSWWMGIIGAEYLSGIVPIGTHSWDQFVKPEELITLLGQYDIEVLDVVGVIYNPITGSFRLDYDDIGVNYMMAARKIRKNTNEASKQESRTPTEAPSSERKDVL